MQIVNFKMNVKPLAVKIIKIPKKGRIGGMKVVKSSWKQPPSGDEEG